MFYQLKSFDESLPDSTIAAQAGMLGSSFTGAQFLTAMMWGRISDSEKGGRKLVIMIGLIGTSKSSMHLAGGIALKLRYGQPCLASALDFQKRFGKPCYFAPWAARLMGMLA